jgi:uncharacterized paraquat-inducible protein A
MSQIVPCQSCGQKNRVPVLPAGKAARCGRCHDDLVVADADEPFEDVDDEDEDEED